MERFVVVGDVEARRVIAQSTQRAVAASVCRLEPIVDRSTQVYLPDINNDDDDDGDDDDERAVFSYTLNF